MSSVAQWLFFESIYGTGIAAAIFYGLALALGRIFKKNFQPEVWAVSGFLIALIVLPTVPRIQFERETRAELELSPWVHITEEIEYGSFTEPLTWFMSNTGYFRGVFPDPLERNSFWEMSIKYQVEQDSIRLLDVDCEQNVYYVSKPNNKGVLKTFPNRLNLSEEEIYLFCKKDWKVEREVLVEAIARGDTS